MSTTFSDDVYFKSGRPWVDVRAYGVKGDTQTTSTASVTANSNVLNTTGNPTFSSTDVGKTVVINGAGSNGGQLTTTIAAYSTPNQVLLNNPLPGTSISNTGMAWGTDDTANFQAALTACNTSGQFPSAVCVPPGRYLITSQLQCNCDLFGLANAFGGYGAVLYFTGTGTCLQNSRASATVLYRVGPNIRYVRINLRYNQHSGVIGIEFVDGVTNGWFQQVEVIGYDTAGTTAYGIYLRGQNPTTLQVNNVTGNHLINCNMTNVAIGTQLGDNITNGQGSLNIVTYGNYGPCTTACLQLTGYANTVIGCDLGEGTYTINAVVLDGAFCYDNTFIGCTFETKAAGQTNAAINIHSNATTFGQGAIVVLVGYVLLAPTTVLVWDQGSSLEPRYTDVSLSLLHNAQVRSVRATDVALILRALSGQSADLMQWQNAGGTANVGRMDTAGDLWLSGSLTVGSVSTTPTDGAGLSVGGRAQTSTANRFRMFQSMARSHVGTAVSVPNASATAVTFDTNDINTDGMWSSGANTRMTAPITGKYLVISGILWVGSSSGTREVSLRKNGSAVFAQADANALSSGSALAMVVSDVITLSASDYVEVMAYQTSGSALNVAADARSYFDMLYVGE